MMATPTPEMREMYGYLKGKGQIKSATFDEFVAKMQNPGVLARVHSFVTDNKVFPTDNVEAFKTMMGLTDPKTETPSRNLPKDVVLKYSEHVRNQNITPLVNVEETDPLMYDKEKFTDFYRQKAVKKLSPGDQQFYNNSAPENRDSFLALRGGLPDFEQYQKVVRTYEQGNRTPTDWPNIDFKKPGDQNVTVYKGIKGK